MRIHTFPQPIAQSTQFQPARQKRQRPETTQNSFQPRFGVTFQELKDQFEPKVEALFEAMDAAGIEPKGLVGCAIGAIKDFKKAQESENGIMLRFKTEPERQALIQQLTSHNILTPDPELPKGFFPAFKKSDEYYLFQGAKVRVHTTGPAYAC